MLEMLDQYGPDDVVVIHQKGELRRHEFLELVNLRALRYRELKLEPGARVLLVLPNSLELLVSYYACIATGLIAVPVNVRMSLSDILRVAEHAGPELVISSHDVSTRLDLVEFFPDCEVEVLEDLHEQLGSVAETVLDDSDWPELHPVAIFYTSGSTGEPKGVVYSHRSLRQYSRMMQEQFGLVPSDRSVVCHCLAQNFGFAQLCVPFLDCGGSVQIVDFASAAQTADALVSGVTFLRLVPWFAPELLEYCLAHEIRAPALRNLIIGGDRVQKSIFDLCREALGIQAAEMYGLTETNTFCVCPANLPKDKIGSIGLPFPQTEVAIRDKYGRNLDIGQVGEICVRTPARMKEYWRDHERTADFIKDDWIATGDAGHMDEDGYLWFNARMKNIIIHDGDNIFPSELEREISHYPGVREVVVAGIPDDVHGESVAAAIVTEVDVEFDQQVFLLYLSERLAETKIPTRLLILDELPLTRAGKADRDMVKSLLAGA